MELLVFLQQGGHLARGAKGTVDLLIGTLGDRNNGSEAALIHLAPEQDLSLLHPPIGAINRAKG